jgi:hypothetical protein
MVRHFQGAKFVKILQATRWMQLDQPQVFDDEVLAFFGKNKN